MMDMFNQFMAEYFDVLILFTIIWLLAWILVSIIYRKIKGKGVMKQHKSIVVYEDKTASGRSLKNWYTALGGARGVLMITVTDANLLIRPFFPFNLMFLPEIFDLEHKIKISSIIELAQKPSINRDKIVVKFLQANETKALELIPHDATSFIKALGTNHE